MVHAARAGDRTAYLTLYDQFAPAVLATIDELAPPDADAEDMLAEVFEAVLLEDAPAFSADFSVGDWLFELTYMIAA